jgi:hypothetical protein
MAYDPKEEDNPSGMDGQYYGAAAQLLPQQGQQAPPPPIIAPPQQPQQQIPYYLASASQAPTAPPSQAAMTPKDASGQTPPAAAPTIMFPSAPAPMSNDIPAYQAIANKTKADSVAPKVAPKWWERLAGAAVGFGVGYKEGPSAGLRAGSAVTNRGQDTALSAQQNTLAGDAVDRDAWQKSHDLNAQAYEQHSQQFGQDMRTAEAKQGQQNLAQEQANRDAELRDRRDNITREQENIDRTYRADQQFHADALKQQGVMNNNESRRIGIEGQREKREAEKVASGPKTTMSPAGRRALGDSHDREYAAEQKTYEAALKAAGTDPDTQSIADRAKAESDHLSARNDLQDRWNKRFAEADPQGIYTDKGNGQQPQVTPTSQVQAPQSTKAPKDGDTKTNSSGDKVVFRGGKWGIK